MVALSSVITHLLLFVALYFEVLLLIAFLEQFPNARRKEGPDAAPEALPLVAVVVPCHNEERTVGKTIESLLGLSYPAEKLSIIVVDDGSTDETLRVARAYERYPNVEVHTKANGGKHSALNFALGRTSADFIGCLDADSFVEQNALRNIIPHFSDPLVAAVTPAIKVHEPKNMLELIQKAEYGLSIFVRKAFGFLDAIFITPGPFSIFRRGVLGEIGGFREAHFTEDLEIGLRLQSHGYRITNAHDAYVSTVPPRTLRSLIRQRVRWTYGFLKNALDYRFMFFRRKHGTLGLLVLPVVTLSVFSALYFFGMILYKIGSTVAEKIGRFSVVGFASPSVSVDWFFINTSSAVLILAALLAVTVSLLALGKLLAEERFVSLDVALYFVCYGFLAPLWLARAVLSVAFSRKGSWK